MTDESSSIGELKEAIETLPDDERAVVIEALHTEQRDEGEPRRPSPPDALREYCRAHPEDPLCRGIEHGQRSRDARSSARDVFDEYPRAPPGGGCTEMWEYLSQYRGDG